MLCQSDFYLGSRVAKVRPAVSRSRGPSRPRHVQPCSLLLLTFVCFVFVLVHASFFDVNILSTAAVPLYGTVCAGMTSLGFAYHIGTLHDIT